MLRRTASTFATAAVAAAASQPALNLYKTADAEALLQRQKADASALVEATRMDAAAWTARFMQHHPAGTTAFRHMATSAGTAGGATANLVAGGAYSNGAHYQEGGAFAAPVNVHAAPEWSIAHNASESAKFYLPPFVVALVMWAIFHDFFLGWANAATLEHDTMVAKRRAKVQAELHAAAQEFRKQQLAGTQAMHGSQLIFTEATH